MYIHSSGQPKVCVIRNYISNSFLHAAHYEVCIRRASQFLHHRSGAKVTGTLLLLHQCQALKCTHIIHLIIYIYMVVILPLLHHSWGAKVIGTLLLRQCPTLERVVQLTYDAQSGWDPATTSVPDTGVCSAINV